MPENEITPEPTTLASRQQQGNNQALEVRRLVQIARDRFDAKYRIMRDDATHLSCVQIKENGILRPVDDRVVINHMVSLLAGLANPSLIKREVFPQWQVLAAMDHPLRDTEVVPIVFKSDTTTPWAWQRLPFDPEEAACPEVFTKMLRRTSPEEAKSLTLWLGSLLDYRFPRSQYMYLHGVGNDGKSTLIAMLIRLLGTQGVAIMRADDFKDAHSTTALEGARLVLFTDENSASFMSKGRFKALTGDDTLTINPKGMPRRNIRLHCKVMVASNFPPYVQGGRADMRRIIPVQLNPIEQASRSEATGFIEQGAAIMQYCYGEFRRWCEENPDAPDLPASDAALSEVQADSMQTDLDSWIEANLAFGEGRTVVAATLASYVRENLGGVPIQNIYQLVKRRGARRRQVGADRTWTWDGVAIRPPASLPLTPGSV